MKKFVAHVGILVRHTWVQYMADHFYMQLPAQHLDVSRLLPDQVVLDKSESLTSEPRKQSSTKANATVDETPVKVIDDA